MMEGRKLTNKEISDLRKDIREYQTSTKPNEIMEKAEKFIKEKLIISKEDWLREMEAYKNQELQSLQTRIKELEEERKTRWMHINVMRNLIINPPDTWTNEMISYKYDLQDEKFFKSLLNPNEDE